MPSQTSALEGRRRELRFGRIRVGTRRMERMDTDSSRLFRGYRLHRERGTRQGAVHPSCPRVFVKRYNRQAEGLSSLRGMGARSDKTSFGRRTAARVSFHGWLDPRALVLEQAQRDAVPRHSGRKGKGKVSARRNKRQGIGDWPTATGTGELKADNACIPQLRHHGDWRKLDGQPRFHGVRIAGANNLTFYTIGETAKSKRKKWTKDWSTSWRGLGGVVARVHGLRKKAKITKQHNQPKRNTNAVEDDPALIRTGTPTDGRLELELGFWRRKVNKRVQGSLQHDPKP
ncbi:hypothetical protein C8R45DRAFT_1083256 [Mycena sanguinolenta]|nr:hypothetical protein C8R45DRAFT_1083256 [Mycena sanguinolenta]